MDSANHIKHLRVVPQVLLALAAGVLTACAPAVRPDAAPSEAAPLAAAAPQAPAESFTVPELGPDPALEPTLPPGDLWERIRDGLEWADAKDHRIDHQLRWYASNQEYLDRVVTRAQPYFRFIVDELERRKMPMELALLPIVESAYDPFAYSHGRAAGLWQFIPGTGRRYSLKLNWWYDGRRDIYESTRAALDYLQDLHAEFGGDWLLALAAYNSGEGRVHRAVRANRKKGKPTDFWHLKLPTETAAYVPKMMALRRLVNDPDAYGIGWTPVPDAAYLARVEVPGQIDLAVAAGLAGISMREFYLLNPGFNRWATDPDGPHAIVVPLEVEALFRERLAKLPREEMVRWNKHTVAKGETLYSIAQKNRVSVEMLTMLNQIDGAALSVGQQLLVPTSALPMSTYAGEFASALTGRLPDEPLIDQRITYVVAPGDDVWRVARDHGVSAAQIARWNGILPGDALAPGSELVVWQAEAAADGNAVRPVLFEPLATTRTINYVVRRGDTLAAIGKRFGVTVAQLAEWNKVPKNKKLRRGQRLKVKVDVTQESSRS
jgi:membrane-bound lytic murein transglycosylase D